MPISTQNPSTVTALAGSWTSLTNSKVIDAATATMAVTNFEEGKLKYENFGFDGVIPSGRQIAGVSVKFRGASGGSVRIQVYTTVSGGAVLVGETTGVVNITLSDVTFDLTHLRAWTRADLLDGAFHVVVIMNVPKVPLSYAADGVEVTVTHGLYLSGDAETVTAGSYAASTADYVPARYQIEVRRSGLPYHYDLLGVLDDYKSFSYVRRYDEPGTFQMTVRADHPLIDELKTRRCYIRVLRNGVEEFAGFTMSRAFAGGRATPENTWTFTGIDLFGLMRKRSALSGQNGAGSDGTLYTGSAGSIVSSAITDAYINPVNIERGNYYSTINLADAEIGYASAAGETLALVGQNQMLVEFVTDILRRAGMGIRARMNLGKGQATFDIYNGIDRRAGRLNGADMLFDLDSHSVTELQYEDDGFSVVNTVYVAGDGDGRNRIVREVTDLESKLLWGRQEAYYAFPGAGSSSTYLDGQARLRLAQRAESQSVRVVLDQARAAGYRRRWDVGDIVTVNLRDAGELIDLRVTEVAVDVPPRGPVAVAPTFGRPSKQLAERLSDLRRELFAATQNSVSEYAYTKEVSGPGRTTVSDSDFGVPPRAGTLIYVRDTTSGDVRTAVKLSDGGYYYYPAVQHTAVAYEISGAGKVTVTDADFTSPPIVGSTVTIRNTTDGTVRMAQKTTTGWVVISAPLSKVNIAHEVSGVGKTTVSDSDFPVAPPEGTTVFVRNLTDGTIRLALKTSSGWRVSPPFFVNESVQVAVFPGAAKTTVSDADFATTPLNGTTAIAHNTSDNTYYQGTRVNGAWRHIQIT